MKKGKSILTKVVIAALIVCAIVAAFVYDRYYKIPQNPYLSINSDDVVVIGLMFSNDEILMGDYWGGSGYYIFTGKENMTKVLDKLKSPVISTRFTQTGLDGGLIMDGFILDKYGNYYKIDITPLTIRINNVNYSVRDEDEENGSDWIRRIHDILVSDMQTYHSELFDKLSWMFDEEY